MIGPVDAISLCVVGIAVGVMSAMFGVGGGVLMVPFLVFAVGATQHAAEGTSLLVIVPTAVAGVVAHRKRGYVLTRPALLIALSGVPGAFFGARLALSIDPESLQRIFGAFVVLVGIRLVSQNRIVRPVSVSSRQRTSGLSPSGQEGGPVERNEQDPPIEEEVTEPTEDEHPSSPGVAPDDNEAASDD